jgi:hypothetical protein
LVRCVHDDGMDRDGGQAVAHAPMTAAAPAGTRLYSMVGTQAMMVAWRRRVEQRKA